MKLATPEDRAGFKRRTGKTIPPAWTDVRISTDPDAKLMVTGRDAKGRAQSIYSAQHTAHQAEVKFQRVRELAKHTDKLDHAISRDAMVNDDAAALMLIRRLGMRPGSNQNTGAAKQAHGATNIKAEHVRVNGDEVTLDFTGKKGVHIVLQFNDPEIAEVLRVRLQTRGGDAQLFNTNETKVRDYMRSTGTPPEFLLKDLRTLRANTVALQQIREMDPPKTKAEFARRRKAVATAVSAQLGNTPAMALSSYINPTVFNEWVRDESWLS
jgi:DNA topoisomerase-1